MAQASQRRLLLPPSPPPAPFSFAPDEPVQPLLSLGLLSERKAGNKNDNGCKNKPQSNVSGFRYLNLFDMQCTFLRSASKDRR